MVCGVFECFALGSKTYKAPSTFSSLLLVLQIPLLLNGNLPVTLVPPLLSERDASPTSFFPLDEPVLNRKQQQSGGTPVPLALERHNFSIVIVKATWENVNVDYKICQS